MTANEQNMTENAQPEGFEATDREVVGPEFLLDCLEEFIEAFEASGDPDLWNTLIEEEMDEVKGALANLLKELTDVAYVLAGYYVATDAQQLDTIPVGHIQTMRRAMAAAAVAEVMFEARTRIEAFRRVHDSNMSKLGDDGKAIRRDDGKIMKGPHYTPPFLDDLIGI